MVGNKNRALTYASTLYNPKKPNENNLHLILPVDNIFAFLTSFEACCNYIHPYDDAAK